MAWWVITYVIFFILILSSNTVYWLKIKGKKLFVLYEFIAGIYLIFVIIAYWVPRFQKHLGIYNVIAVAVIILVDFYFSVWGRLEDLGISFSEIDEKEIEIAKVISIILSAPAYITGTLLSYEILQSA